MLRKIVFKNYRNFINKTIDFSLTAKKINDLICIYGPNASGKSTIVEAIQTLVDSINCIDQCNNYIHFLDSAVEFNINVREITFNNTNFISKNLNKISTFRDDNASLEFFFTIADKNYSYYLEFDVNEVILEALKGPNRNKIYFKRENNNLFLNNTVFLSKKLRKELEKEFLILANTQTFLGLLNSSLNDKYLEKIIDKDLIIILEYLKKIYVDNNQNKKTFMLRNLPILECNISRPKYKKEKAELLKNQLIINDFCKSLNSNIEEMYYVEMNEGNNYRYVLHMKFLCDGEILDVDYGCFSEGTIQLLKILSIIWKLKSGDIVVVDEIDKGVHDMLITTILQKYSDFSKGQLICTSHNTSLLQVLDKKNAYILDIDNKGKKYFYNISSINNIQPNHNIEKLFRSGKLGGTPNSTLNYFFDCFFGDTDE